MCVILLITIAVFLEIDLEAQQADSLLNDSRVFTLGEITVFGSNISDKINSLSFAKIEKFSRLDVSHGRFETLEEVVDHYSEHIQHSATLSPFVSQLSNEINGKSLSLSVAEKKSVISFLRLLTDSTFVTNPEFSDPFNSTLENKFHLQ